MTTEEAQETLKQLVENKQLEPFITHIRFPHYKNLAPETRIEFTYPITAIVGANGTNKSSVLKALYGAPKDFNLGTLWFSTSIDPIAETGERPVFIYGYRNQDTEDVVEVINGRYGKTSDPDYWETSRPVIKYGMKKMPSLASKGSPDGRGKTRWDNIKKNVVYLDFRGSLSAFDKVFYHGELRKQLNTKSNKKNFIRNRSPYLKRAIESENESFSWHVERIVGKENRKLSVDEREKISEILGRKYSEIRWIQHRFFNTDAYTCLMNTGSLRYSEAFAGSGEFSVVRMVVEVMNAPERSLILFDEPEASLHPGAQIRLLDFLSEQVKQYKHQVVISTHSHALIRELPPEAIKVFEIDKHSQKIVLRSQSSSPDEAFFHIGEPVSVKTKVIVEDKLAVALVKRALKSKGEAGSGMFDVKCFPGGASLLWSRRIPEYATENRDDIFVVFDKDEQRKEVIPEHQDIPESDVKKIVHDIAGMEVEFYVDGGDGGTNHDQEITMRRNYIKWIRKHVDYLPGDSNPEKFIWENMLEDDITKQIDGSNYKVRFDKLTRRRLDVPEYESVASNQILIIQLQQLATIKSDHEDLAILCEKMMDFHSSRNSSKAL